MNEPVEPAFEAQVAAALHDHAASVSRTANPSALVARLAHQDKLTMLRRITVAGAAVIVLVLGVLVFGATRRSDQVTTAEGPSATAVAPAPAGTAPGADDGAADPVVDGSPNGTVDGSSGSTSELSIPLPGEVGPDASTSTTGPAMPGGVTTSAAPGAPTTTRPGQPPPSGPTPTSPSGPPGPTTATTAGPTPPTTSGPGPTTPTTAPPTTVDPARQCAAHQVNTVLRAAPATVGSFLYADFDAGLAPPGSTLKVSSTDVATRRLILSTTTVADREGRWTWSIRWNASGTPRNVDLRFYIECANGTRLPFTVRRA